MLLDEVGMRMGFAYLIVGHGEHGVEMQIWCVVTNFGDDGELSMVGARARAFGWLDYMRMIVGGVVCLCGWFGVTVSSTNAGFLVQKEKCLHWWIWAITLHSEELEKLAWDERLDDGDGEMAMDIFICFYGFDGVAVGEKYGWRWSGMWMNNDDVGWMIAVLAHWGIYGHKIWDGCHHWLADSGGQVAYWVSRARQSLRVTSWSFVCEEDSTLVEQSKKPSCSTPVQATHVLGNVEMKGMVNQLKSKVIDTLTLTFVYDVHKHAEVVESEVVNCETNLVELPLVEKDVGVFGVVIDICDMNLVDCLDTNDTDDDFMDNEDNPSQYCLDNIEIGIEEHSHNGELTVSLYDEPQKETAKCSEHTKKMGSRGQDKQLANENSDFDTLLKDENMNLDKLIADVTKYENKSLQMIKASEVNVVKGDGKPQRPTTPQVKKKRKRFNNLSPIEFLVTPPIEVDCSQQTLPPFKEVLRRHSKSNPRKFPWVNHDIVVDEHFWLALLGLDENKSGWMLDDHLDVWIDLLWRFRPAKVDWAIVGPHFCPSILFGQMPLFYASNKRYLIPWSDVEKVYIPLNNPKTHWALGELELWMGVITVYDSMTPRKRNKKFPIQENKAWWIKMRATMTEQLPLYLHFSGVLKSKGLDVSDIQKKDKKKPKLIKPSTGIERA
ncbi:phospholipase-like protein [Tanacetum coccineum]